VGMLVGKGQQRDVARTLDRDGQSSLVFGTGSCLAAAFDLAAISQESAKHVCLLIVDVVDLIDAEHADFAPAIE